MSIVESLIFGLKLPFTALRLILKTPKLLLLSLLPISVTLALYIYGFKTAQNWLNHSVLALLNSWGVDPSGWVSFAVTSVLSLILILVSAITFSVVAAVASSPFNDFLAEAAESFGTPKLPSVGKTTFMQRVGLIRIDLMKSMATLFGTGLAIAVSWVPGLNVVGIWLAVLLLCFQYASYPQTRRGITMSQGIRFLWSHLWSCTGFGLTLSLLFAIPLVSAFMLPLAVVAGTLLVARSQAHGLR